MTYKEIVNKTNKSNIDREDLKIAIALDAKVDFDYTDEEFNQLCEYAKRVLHVSEVTVDAIANHMDDLLNEEDKTIKEILEMDIHKFGYDASLWMEW